MPQLDTLNSAIALVLVILLLSLIVQSLQGLLKKALKIKSRQIEDSLIDLFERVMPNAQTPQQSTRWQRLTAASPFLRIFTTKANQNNPDAHPDENVRTLFQEVTSNLRGLGRVAQSGKPILDSIAKDDLLKVMEKVPASYLLPDPAIGAATPVPLAGAVTLAGTDTQAALLRLPVAPAGGGVAQLTIQAPAVAGSVMIWTPGAWATERPLIVNGPNPIDVPLSAVGPTEVLIPATGGQAARLQYTGPAPAVGASLVSPPPAESVTKLVQRAWLSLGRLQALLKALDAKASHFTGGAGAKYAALRQALAPLVSDADRLLRGGTPKPSVLIGDLFSLRDLSLNNAYGLLAEIQDSVKADLSAAGGAGGAAGGGPLAGLSNDLQSLGTTVLSLQNAVDGFLAPLRAKLKEVETWYDTVMQSFDERYNRGMRTWSIVISAIVVLCLNANFFTIFHATFSNPATRNAILDSQQRILTQYESEYATQQIGKVLATTRPATTAPVAPAPAAAPAATTAPATTAPAAAMRPATTQPSSPPDPQAELKALVDQARGDVKNDVDLYSGFGFGWGTFNQDLAAHSGSRFIQFLKCLPGWIPGWAIMTVLLSFGAPFWHDALESLFGVKNLLQQKTENKNVESKSGAGNPKT